MRNKVLVSFVGHRLQSLGHSHARLVWDSLPDFRKVEPEEADIILYDEVEVALNDFMENARILRIIVSPLQPKMVPKGLFWMKPDKTAFLNLVRTLNP